MLEKIKIKNGLYCVLGVFVLLLLSVCSFSLYSSMQSNQSIRKVSSIEGEQLIPLYSAYSEMLNARLAGINIALAIEGKKDNATIQASLERLDGYITSANNTMAELRKIPSLTPQGQALRDEIDALFNDYMNNAVAPMLTTLRNRNTAQFYDTLVPEALKKGATFRLKLNQFVDLAKNVSDEESNHAENFYYHTIKILIATLVIVVLLSLVTLKFIRTVVLTPMQKVRTYFGLMEQGVLTLDIPPQHNTEMGELMLSLKDMQQAFRKIVLDVRESASSVAAGAEQISSANRDFAARTEAQASSVEQTAASMEQITASVQENTANTGKAMTLTNSVAELAEKNASNFSQMIERIQHIADSSNKINEIISIMDGIAFQTNILALNAAVEAARAGEAGKGFAVVASEVRSLAQRSAGSAREIKELIEKTANEITQGEKVASHSTQDMAQLMDEIKRVNEFMADISIASSEQAKGIEQVNAAITLLEQASQQNAALVEESASASSSLHEQATHLDDTMTFFNLNDSSPVAIAALR
ncbi:methyl-accepting chemotaxis protein [Dickeya sp. CFBP 2040]|uniref:methyl-accepting chemotaxis protein n=1 Tax=Dickeya sp. CFBP 2040 TaxID=2718531 RepID=UPI001446F6F1|nr:methyl-accepting chemotaxis protein [Dickeya sp. CFBP 2040]NKI75385.1 methyl-accepting chemotaxis protein [Dickeya sp. CFBP 2040]